MTTVTIALATAAAILMLPVISDLVSIARLLRVRHPRPLHHESPRLLFLVPAHNEEQLIAPCVESLRLLRYSADLFCVVVIADNCTDRTAALAAEHGARCLERHDPASPGKPQAIAWALKQLRLDGYDAVIIIDADSTVDPRFATALAKVAPLRNKVLQAYFDVANPRDSALTRMAAVLSAANFRFAYPLKERVRVNMPLLGNGMCIGTGVLQTHGWKAFGITENWELYARYTMEGVTIEGVNEARVYAQEARSLGQSYTQRRRWMAGKLTVLLRYLGAILCSPRIGLFQKLDAAAQLSAPGPVVHLGLAIAGAAIIWLTAVPHPLWLMVALWLPIARLMTYALCGLATQPHPMKAALAFVYLPVYAGWRLVTAVSSLTMIGKKTWVRTARH